MKIGAKILIKYYYPSSKNIFEIHPGQFEFNPRI